MTDRPGRVGPGRPASPALALLAVALLFAVGLAIGFVLGRTL
jgi:hypothetical protein